MHKASESRPKRSSTTGNFYYSDVPCFEVKLRSGMFTGGRDMQSKYPPAEPGALDCEPLEAASRGR
jgi:hypothetical protein